MLDFVHQMTMVMMEYAINCCSMVTVRLRMGAHGAPGVRCEVRLRRNLGASHMCGAGCGARLERADGLGRSPGPG